MAARRLQPKTNPANPRKLYCPHCASEVEREPKRRMVRCEGCGHYYFPGGLRRTRGVPPRTLWVLLAFGLLPSFAAIGAVALGYDPDEAMVISILVVGIPFLVGWCSFILRYFEVQGWLWWLIPLFTGVFWLNLMGALVTIHFLFE